MPPPYSKKQVDRAGQVFARRGGDGLPDLGQTQEAEAVIDWWRSEHAKPLSRVAANLRYYAQQEGLPIVGQRLKRVPTIANKLRREPRMKLSRMADIAGVRAVVPDQVAAYRIASNLRRNWTITKFRDYVAVPKTDGYRALHLVNRHRGRLIEIQLRTENQDRWANRVELLSRFAYPGLKYGEGSPGVRQYMYDWAKILARHDSGQIESEEIDDLLTAQVITLLREANES